MKIFLATLLCLLPIAAPCATDAHESVAESLVLVVISGLQGEASDCFQCPYAQIGTGFFYTPDGGIVTSAHLLQKVLSKQVPRSEISIQIQRGNEDVEASQPKKAVIEYLDVEHDVLLLRTAAGTKPFPYLKYRSKARSHISVLKTRVHSYGFPEGYGLFPSTGTISKFQGPDPLLYLWTTDMEIKSGMSGSPVFLLDGSVVGIAKGSEAGLESFNFIVPVDYAVNLSPTQFESFESTTTARPNLQPTGSVQILAAVRSKDREIRERQEILEFRGARCDPSVQRSQSISGTPGWSILPTSIRVETLQTTFGSVLTSANSVDGGIEARALLRNGGVCVRAPLPFGDDFVVRDTIGSLRVRIAFEEYRDTDSSTLIPIKVAPATAGTVIATSLPPDSIGFQVAYQRPDGTEQTTEEAGRTGDLKVAQKDGALEVSIDK